MKVTLKIWRQPDGGSEGTFERYEGVEIDEDASFLEMLDVLNDRLLEAGERPVAFDHDCREGICGACSLLVDDIPHGPRQVTSCQIYMRDFEDGQEITIEPFRATAFPVLRDLMVDRSPLDRVVESGGYISVNAGPKPEPNSIPVHPEIQEAAMDAAICIGCGACVAACPNGSGMLFTGAKLTHLNLLPQGEPERFERATEMVLQMDKEAFGHCTWHGECAEACPKGIPLASIAAMNLDFTVANLLRSPSVSSGDGGG
jgi:succinate dehydrogenase / fumarate reductase, iron-sulfur subunit